MNDYTTNDEGVDLIKEEEGLRLKPYLCPTGHATIGYGCTYYEDGRAVKLTDKPITVERADELLQNILSDFEDSLRDLLTTEVNENQFSALVSFTYNIGVNKFSKSTLLRKVNIDPYDDSIGNEFKKWVYGNVRGEMVVLDGLKRRREKESALYYS